MSRLTIKRLPLPGLVLVKRHPLTDERGFFTRIFCAQELTSAGWSQPVAQINHARTNWRGTVRGLHYQRAPHAEAKLVTCVRGEVWDVAVDLRAGSPTFLHWHAERLSGNNGHAMLIPQGFAHGFQALSDDVELLYCHSTAYVPDAEAGLNACDPRLAIPWPLPIAGRSERDVGLVLLNDNFEGVAL
jgi:dTDP-4-dehydrorhamnose 3,5-epimerase